MFPVRVPDNEYVIDHFRLTTELWAMIMRAYRLSAVMALLFALGAFHNKTYAQGIPNVSPCMGVAQHGMQVPANQVTGQPPAWAMTIWPNGYPTIVYGPVYFQLPPLIQRFTSLHECGHASTGNPDEYAANCYALSAGNFTPAQIRLIRTFYQSLSMTIPPQYGGSGIGFWAGTMGECPQFNY